MKRTLALLSLVSILLLAAACGGTESTSGPVAETGSGSTPIAETEELAEELEAAVEMVADAATAAPAEVPCDDFFRYCVTSTLSGSVNATATAGMGGNIESCAAWVAEGEPRIVELPMMQAAGGSAITVALTRIGAYTGPGTYDLQPVVKEGMPDMFPAIMVDGRAFNNGEGSTAVVTIAPDGSGTVEARGLVEIASVQVSNPDPEARIDFSMQWTCRDN